MPKTYDHFAAVYDLMGADHHSLRMCDYTIEIFRKHKIKPQCGLEICCGTGSALKFFADHGYQMTGVDQSRQMLIQARRKVGKRATLQRAVLPELRIVDQSSKRRRQFDFAYSYYDSLNYLLSARDLHRAFRNVSLHLQPGGWFIFDMNTPRALREVWGNTYWGGALKDLCWLFKNSYDHTNKLGMVRITLFVRTGKCWKRYNETHVERGYPNAVIRELLSDADLSVKAIYKCFTYERATDRTNRICVVARKK
jgi:SAM-dependent methyltransferase